jgi:hypothetical protein
VSSVKVDSHENQVLFDADEGNLLNHVFRLWIIVMVPAVALSLQLLYFMARDAPTSGMEAESSPDKSADQSKMLTPGKYHEFEDADQSIRLAKWLDQFRFLGLTEDSKEQEVRGVYHFLDQCKAKLGYDYI